MNTLPRRLLALCLVACCASIAAAQKDTPGSAASSEPIVVQGVALGTPQADGTRWIGPLPLEVGAPTNVTPGQQTALQTYVAFDDGAFAWEKKGEIDIAGVGKAHLLRMTSQRWRLDAETDHPLWKHWVVVGIPDKIRSDTAILIISGGRHREETPTQAPSEMESLMRVTGAPVIFLDNVPNQPLVLEGDGQSRVEDNILARSWMLAIRENDASWIGQFPMTKAAVRAMDAVDAFTKQLASNTNPAGNTMPAKPLVTGYFVAGGSKRGWTSWLTAATGDARVKAIAPAVIDMLNMPAHTPHHFASYGFWAPALKDYVNNGIAEKFGTPELSRVIAHVDPIGYVPAIGKMPTYLMHAGGDEFFPTDSARHYESLLTGPGTEHRHIRVMPNAGHGLRGSTAWPEVMTFFMQVRAGKQIPSIAWTTTDEKDGGELTVTASTKPLSVTLWRVENPSNRDFRIDQTGPNWKATTLEASDERGTKFTIKLEAPEKGWRASMVVVAFDAGNASPTPLTMSTRVFITPDTLPHSDKLPLKKP
jgi:PhoPQ-activated pathogenicity-related protein